MGTVTYRLKRLESSQGTPDSFTDVLELISQGAYYDELTEEQKERYYSYHYEPMEPTRDNIKAFEDLRRTIDEMESIARGKHEKNPNVLHFKLSVKEEPWSQADIERVIQEIESEL